MINIPIYEYKCPSHGTFEVVQSFQDAPLSKCVFTRCYRKVKKLISLSSFHLVGDGWYKTEAFKDKVSTIEKQLEVGDRQEEANIARARREFSKKLVSDMGTLHSKEV